MAEYIDKEKLLQKLSRMIEYCKDDNKVNGLTALFQVGDAIMDCPTADVQEVKHARWLPYRFGLEVVACSNCRAVYEGGDSFRFCPKCGAKMDLED